MLVAGLAVLPADGGKIDGKMPLVKGWRSWRGPPSVKAVEQFAQKFPTSNIAFLPGASGLFVADVDTADQAGEVEELLGRTPLHVLSNRGTHLYYRNVKGCTDVPVNLRAMGLDVDFKSGNSIVIAPPSRHIEGTVYRLDNCDWLALEHLPDPNLGRLQDLLARKPARRTSDRYTEGERGLGLNRLLCRHAGFVETFDELLDVARTINDDFLPPLRDAEVIKRARQAWEDARTGKLEPWVGRKAVARTTASEIKDLSAKGCKGSDAFMLLMLLRAEHGARCARGKTFSIVTEAMQRAQTIPGWNSKRYVAARDLLLNVGLIQRVSTHKCTRSGRLPAQYKLASRSIER
jgi:hypothetical protein